MTLVCLSPQPLDCALLREGPLERRRGRCAGLRLSNLDVKALQAIFQLLQARSLPPQCMSPEYSCSRLCGSSHVSPCALRAHQPGSCEARCEESLGRACKRRQTSWAHARASLALRAEATRARAPRVQSVPEGSAGRAGALPRAPERAALHRRALDLWGRVAGGARPARAAACAGAPAQLGTAAALLLRARRRVSHGCHMRELQCGVQRRWPVTRASRHGQSDRLSERARASSLPARVRSSVGDRLRVRGERRCGRSLTRPRATRSPSWARAERPSCWKASRPRCGLRGHQARDSGSAQAQQAHCTGVNLPAWREEDGCRAAPTCVGWGPWRAAASGALALQVLPRRYGGAAALVPVEDAVAALRAAAAAGGSETGGRDGAADGCAEAGGGRRGRAAAAAGALRRWASAGWGAARRPLRVRVCARGGRQGRGAGQRGTIARQSVARTRRCLAPGWEGSSLWQGGETQGAFAAAAALLATTRAKSPRLQVHTPMGGGGEQRTRTRAGGRQLPRGAGVGARAGPPARLAARRAGRAGRARRLRARQPCEQRARRPHLPHALPLSSGC